MSLKFPDILKHKNSKFAIVDVEDVKGGCMQVVNETARNLIPIDKRKIRMIVSYNDGLQEVTKKYLGVNVEDINWTNNNNWYDLVGSGGVSYLFANGVYNDSGTVKLGVNQIEENTNIDISPTFQLLFSSEQVTDGALAWRSFIQQIAGEDEITIPSLKAYIEETVGGNEIGVQITDSGILVFNEYNGQGLYYLADYTTYFDSENRAIPDVGWVNTKISEIVFVISAATSDIESDLSNGTDKAIFFMPYNMELTEIFAGLGTVCSGSIFITDINLNGTTILSTKISIDAGENTSLTAATPPAISTSTLPKGGKITVDFDQVGAIDTGKAHTVYLKGTIS